MRVFVLFTVTLMIYGCKKDVHELWSGLDNIDSDKIYLAYRGTQSKIGFLVRDFNIVDTLSSHIGILVFENEGPYVYNIADFNDEGSDLRKQEVSDFFYPENETVFYSSVWEVKLNREEKKKVCKILNCYLLKDIKFDKRFELDKPERLYCSEFVYKVLFELDSDRFDFTPHKQRLKGVYKSYLQKDTLVYFPADIFQLNKSIVKVSEVLVK